MGQHRQALEIYVFKLEDYTKAEESVLTTYELATPLLKSGSQVLQSPSQD